MSVSRLQVSLIFFIASMYFCSAHAVSIEELTRSPEISQLKISPSGDYLAGLLLRDGRHFLSFLDRKTYTELGAFRPPGSQEVGKFYWANDERVVFQIYEVGKTQEAPKNYGELGAVNFDGSKAGRIFGIRAHINQSSSQLRKKKADQAWARIIDMLEEDKQHILISSTPMTRTHNTHATAQMLNIYSGVDVRRVITSRFPNATFLTDPTGKVRFVKSTQSDRSIHIQSLQAGPGSEWENMSSGAFTRDVLPLAINTDDDSVYTLDRFESDTLGLYKLQLDGTSARKIYAHDQVDITKVAVSTNGRNVYAIQIDAGLPSYLLFSKSHEEARIFKHLLETFPGKLVSITSNSDDGRYWIVNTRSDIDPGSFYLFDKDQNKVSLMFRSKPKIKSAELAPVEPIEFVSFDGIAISGYLTRAKNSSVQPPPLVVLVHGGPRGRDYWKYSPVVQTLATNGYSVLQVNFRGSEGYGRTFMHAGDRHWGDHIQQDIIAGTRWAIDNKHASKNRICIMGGSFGAYSAVQSAIIANDLYTCVVANAGLYDLSLMNTRGDIEKNYGGKTYLDEVIGDDKQQLLDFSPVHHIAKLKAPVFIAHGKRDVRTPFVHAKRLKKAMDKHKKPYEWFVKSREGHGFYKDENQADYLNAAIAFLDKHIGGK